jgi:hypothetical protein
MAHTALADPVTDVIYIDIVYESVRGWHQFTSPQMRGLYVIAEPKDLKAGLGDVPGAIEELLAISGKKVTVRPDSKYPPSVEGLREGRQRFIGRYEIREAHARRS